MSRQSDFLVYPVGTEVSVGDAKDKIKGVIRSIQIEANDAVSYAVAWWSGRERKDVWIPSHEINGADRSGKPIGFHQ